LRTSGHARRADAGHDADGYRRFRETVGEPECVDRGADHDVAGAGPDHQQPGADAHDQQPHPDADHSGPDTNDGDPHAYAYDDRCDTAAADTAYDAHAVTRMSLPRSPDLKIAAGACVIFTSSLPAFPQIGRLTLTIRSGGQGGVELPVARRRAVHPSPALAHPFRCGRASRVTSRS
jgi:hypothetical protein